MPLCLSAPARAEFILFIITKGLFCRAYYGGRARSLTEAMNKKQSLSVVLAVILSMLVAVLIFVGGMSAGKAAAGGHNAAVAAMAVCASLIVILSVVSTVAAAVRSRRRDKMKHDEVGSVLMEKKADAEGDLDAVGKKLSRIAALSIVYMVFLALVAAALTFAAGFAVATGSEDSEWITVFVIITVYIYIGLLFRIFATLFDSGFDWSEYSKPEDYPVLYSLAERAMKTVGLSGEIRIIILGDDNCGIANARGNIYSIQLGDRLLAIMTEEELYTVLLHEFAHMSRKYTPKNLPRGIINFLSLDDSGLFGLCAAPYRLPVDVFCFEYVIYQFTASKFIEAGADSVIASVPGQAETFASALVKLNMTEKYMRANRTWTDDNCFDPEQAREDPESWIIGGFKNAYAEMNGFWFELMERELPPRISSHPIVRERVEAVGVKLGDVKYSLPDDAGTPYRKDCDKALEYGNAQAHKFLAENYEANRKQYFTENNRIVDEWIAAGKPIVAEEMRPVIDALGMLGRYDEQLELCREITETAENRDATAHALYIMGDVLLDRYDDRGIDCIWEAIEINDNYALAGLEKIGTYCCECGLKEQLEDYRARSGEIMDRRAVTDEACSLTVHDRLEKDDILGEELPPMLEFMVNAGEGSIGTIYLVKKILSDKRGTSVFVIDFVKDTSEERIDGTMEKIFNFLDTYPSHEFSLFMLDDETRAAVGKVHGSAVWKKND